MPSTTPTHRGHHGAFVGREQWLGSIEQCGHLPLDVTVAEERGLTDNIVTQAEGLVGEAQRQFNDNAARREWAVAALIAAKVPEWELHNALAVAANLCGFQLRR
jgi:hypothetical protein